MYEPYGVHELECACAGQWQTGRTAAGCWCVIVLSFCGILTLVAALPHLPYRRHSTAILFGRAVASVHFDA